MSQLYSNNHRALQDKFDTRRMADMMEGAMAHSALTPAEQAFICSRDMFWLSTVDAHGQPTVSYKGGAPGFVVASETELAFPSYDGNGMYYSLGNLTGHPQVGMLFMNFETPHRLRVHGKATVSGSDPLMETYPEAQLIVRVTGLTIWLNCPRYVHRMQRVDQSKYVPKAGCETPVPAWKRIDIIQDALPAKDQGKAAALGGTLTFDEYAAKAARGEG